jgi:hypothetical protein
LLLNYIDRHPKIKGFIEISFDTNMSYQVKKVEWAVQELIKEGEAVMW